MKNASLLICALGWIAAGPVALGAPAPGEPDPIIIHLAVIDNIDTHARDVAARTRRLRRLHPATTVHEILIYANATDYADRLWRASAREHIRASLTRLLADGSMVRGFILNIHGNGDYLRSTVGFLGHLLDAGPDRKLRDSFAPLAGRQTRDARVVLLSCAILNCGRPTAARRMGNFMSWLGATDGTLNAFEGRLVTNLRPWLGGSLRGVYDAHLKYATARPLETVSYLATFPRAAVMYAVAAPALSYVILIAKREGGPLWRTYGTISRGPWNLAREISIRDGRAEFREGIARRFPRDWRVILKCGSDLVGEPVPPTL